MMSFKPTKDCQKCTTGLNGRAIPGSGQCLTLYLQNIGWALDDWKDLGLSFGVRILVACLSVRLRNANILRFIIYLNPLLCIIRD